MNNQTTTTISSAYATTGPLPYTLTNDYLFRALLQRNNHVLKGLICAVLHLSEEEVVSVTIENPIELGKAIDTKTCILDVKVLLNSNTYINLEMQVLNYNNWTERSLTYLCRCFDHLETGNDYSDVKPAFQISFLNYSLFPEYPEFFATYKFLNVKNHTAYSDKLQLSVVDLTHIELATEEDKKYHIDMWASLFKSTTWEEIKMLAENNDYMNEAYESLYLVSKEDDIRLQCEAREEYYRVQRTGERIRELLETKLSEKVAQLNETSLQLEEKDAKLKETTSQLEETTSQLEEKSSQLEETTSQLEEKIYRLEETEAQIKEKDLQIQQLLAQIEELKKQ